MSCSRARTSSLATVGSRAGESEAGRGFGATCLGGAGAAGGFFAAGLGFALWIWRGTNILAREAGTERGG